MRLILQIKDRTRTNSRKTRYQAGFSLIELMLSLLLLTIITGAVFQQIAIMQERYRNEQQKLDIFQNAREFVDQIVRDLHQANFPNKRLYASDPGSAATNDAVGLVYVSPYEIKFEGDVEGTGTVDSVDYQLTGGNPANCPCTITRSQIEKNGVLTPDLEPTIVVTQIENVVNSGAVFQFFKEDGSEFTTWDYSGTTYLTPGHLRTNWSPDDLTENMNLIWTVQVNVDIRSSTGDASNTGKPEVYLRSRAQVRN